LVICHNSVKNNTRTIVELFNGPLSPHTEFDLRKKENHSDVQRISIRENISLSGSYFSRWGSCAPGTLRDAIRPYFHRLDQPAAGAERFFATA
jgi:hypothetical protein